MAKIGIFGAGYVGLVTGACFSDLGHEVVLRDVVPERVEQLCAGEVPIYEPGLAEVLERNRERISFTLDVDEAVDGADFLYVAVGTPPTYSGDADLRFVWSVVDGLPEQVPGRPVIVMKSTVPVGTGERVRARLDARGLRNVGYASNPEFLAEGSAVADFMNPDRIVVGAFEPEDAERVVELHAGIDTEVLRTDVPSAELVKLAANAFLSTRLSFINEIANVCELVGADVVDVARGVGLDHRLGPHYLRAGIGWGGSCLAGDETVLVRDAAKTRLISLERLFTELAPSDDAGLARPDGLEVLAWREGRAAPEWFTVAAATRRRHSGELVELRTKMGRRLRCTPDHPFVVRGERTKVAAELTTEDWLPLGVGEPDHVGVADRVHVLSDSVREEAVIVRPLPQLLESVGARGLQQALTHPRGLSLAGALVGTTTDGTYVPASLRLDEELWRVIGLYIAEGHAERGPKRHRLTWSFHREREFDLVECLLRYWRTLGVEVRFRLSPTSAQVSVSSRLLVEWWLDEVGVGRTSYDKRLPDLIWEAPEAHKRALLSGLWHGDGSWSYVDGGQGVILEYGTVSRELADGIMRLLGELGVVASQRVGRTAKSTCDTYWLRISGAAQIERVLELVPERDHERLRSSIARQAKRIAPTGYRRDANAAWVRVVETKRQPYDGYVYSLEVPGAHTFVTSGGLVTHNCFPKDVTALKQLAGNSGYPFLLLQAVWEVNELQKRRVVSKLQQRLGSLHGRTIALLGLAFKPNTDDMREAPSRVIAYRLLSEGADVRAWDPVATPEDLQGVEICDSVLEAVRGADAAVIVTEWPELREVVSAEVREAMAHPLIVDGRNLLDPEAAMAAGFEYEGIGRPTKATPVGVNGYPQPSRDRETTS